MAQKGATASQADSPGGLLIHVRRGIREAALILALALAGWLLLALVSYDRADPGFSHTGSRDNVINMAGPMGAWFADVHYLLMGAFAFLVPVAFALIAVRLFWARRRPLQWDRLTIALRLLGFVLTLGSGCALATLHWELAGAELPQGTGGIVGVALAAAVSASLGVTGGSLLMLAVFLLGVTLFTGLSWFGLSAALARSFWFASTAVVNGLSRAWRALVVRLDGWRDQRRVRVARRRERKQAIRDARTRQQEAARKQPVVARQEPALPAPATEGAAAKTSAAKPIADKRKQKSIRRPEPRQQPRLFESGEGEAPPLELLDHTEAHERKTLPDDVLENMSRLLESKLADFGVEAEVVAVRPGPVITRFEIQPAAGIKVSRISGLAKDLARSLAVLSVRVVEVIPGKSTVGIEVPNEDREIVRLREILAAGEYQQADSPISMALGKDISGHPVVVDLGRMPHLLVAGTTGSGKSVGVNAMLLSLLYKSGPEDVRLILVDPKMLELSVYEGIPHLLTPVVTDMKEAASALRWCVGEMERRYRMLASLGVRNLAGFNRKVREAAAAGTPLADPLWKTPEVFDGDEPPSAPLLEPLPNIVVVIDEFADMIMIVGKKVEELIARIAQKARAAGIHLILATQRPSVDVITGLIKANIPTRISFQVSSKVDSRTILDQGGAEQLLGHGDMLYLPPGTAVPIRVHGAFVADDEVHRVVSDWTSRGEPDYLPEVLSGGNETVEGLSNGEGGDAEQEDPLYDEAVAFVIDSRRASISAVQRKLRIGYNRAARMVEAMEAAGVVTGMDGSGGREVLVPKRGDEG